MHTFLRGYNIGVRLIEDFLSRSGVNKCTDFKETANIISKLAFKQYLGIQPVVGSWSNDSKTFSLVFTSIPFYGMYIYMCVCMCVVCGVCPYVCMCGCVVCVHMCVCECVYV